jgi:trigger factor
LKVTRGDTVARQTVLHIEVDTDRVDQHLYLLEEALESLVPEAVNEAIKSESLEPSSTPRVSVTEREPVIKLDATVPLSPQVTLGDYQSIRVAEGADAVSEEAVDNALERVREANATWSPVERELRLGDLATITAIGTAEGNQILNTQSTEFLATEGGKYPAPGFAEALAGIRGGESREFTLTFPADYSRADLAGKAAQFKATLNSLKEKGLPALDDGLAKTVGEGLETLADLRKKIRESLQAEATESARRSLERQVLDALVASATFEVAPMLIDHETDHLLYDQQQALARYKLPLERYIQGIGKTADDFVKEARTSAEDRLKRQLVIEKLAEMENVTVSDAAVSAEVERLKSQPDVRQDTDWDALRDTVHRLLRRQAATERAVEIARQSSLILPAGPGAGEETT